MRSQRKSRNQEVDIADLYALKAKALWQALRKEHISFWLLCLYFFFEYVRPQSLYPVLDVLPYSQILMLAALVTQFADNSVHWVRSRQNVLFVIFSIFFTLSSILAFKPLAAWNNRNIVLSWFVVYFLTINIVNSERRLLLFLLAFLLFSFKMSQHGVLDWASRGFSFASYGLIGSPGYFRNSGEFAIQMLIFGSLAIAFVISLKGYWGRYKKWFMYLAAATGYLAVIGASSRGSQLGLAAIGIWMLLRQKGGFKGLVAMLVFAGILYMVLPEKEIARFTEMGTDESSILRLAHWEYALHEVIPKHPVLGIGYANWYPYLYFMVPNGFGPVKTIQDVHNIYLQAAAELGITGLVLFLVLAINAFVTNAHTRRVVKDLDNRLLFNLSYGLDAGLIGYLVAGTFVTVLYYPFFWIQITMIVMLNNVALKTVAQRKKVGTSRRSAS